MKPRQTEVIERIRQEIVKIRSLGKPEEHEFKTWKIDDQGGSGLVFLTAEYGRKGDEGTMVAIMCRYRYHIMVRRGGGVKLLSFSSNLKTSCPKSVRGIFDSVNYWHSK